MNMPEPELNRGREMIQSFIDDMRGDLHISPEDKMIGLVATRLWKIHDEGYRKALEDNGMSPKL